MLRSLKPFTFVKFCQSHLCCSVFSPPWQEADCDQHSLLDRAAPQRPLAVAGQGPHADGLPQHPLLQRLLRKLLLGARGGSRDSGKPLAKGIVNNSPVIQAMRKNLLQKKKVGFLCFVVVFKYPFKPLPLKLSALWLECSGAAAVGIWSWSL